MNALCYIYLLFLCGLYLQTASGCAVGQSNTTFAKEHSILAAKIIKNLAESHAHENLIFSPLSIHTALTLIYLGAEGTTAEELQQALLLSTSDKETVATDYANFLLANFLRDTPDVELNMVNGIFVNQRFQFAETFQQLAQNYFQAISMTLNFNHGDSIVRGINAWVERHTNSKIKNYLNSSSLDDSTSAVVVNALHFKAMWKEVFGDFRLGRIPKMDVDVVELRYKNTDFTMLVLLPKKIDGLKNLENNLQNIDWDDVADDLNLEEGVNVFLPKYKIEFEMDLKEQLQKLGVSKVFSASADLSGLFKTSMSQNFGKGNLEKVQHKVYLEIDEYGTEAAAATATHFSNRKTPISFHVSRPFLFVIRNCDAIFFIGHVVKF